MTMTSIATGSVLVLVYYNPNCTFNGIFTNPEKP